MMDVYISEEYVIQRRNEKKAAKSKACKRPSNDGTAEPAARSRLLEKEKTFRHSLPFRFANEAFAISTTSSGNGDNVVCNCLSA